MKGFQEVAGQTPRVAIGARLWQDRWDSDPSIIGEALRINGFCCTVIGIGQKEFRGASPVIFPADLWLPRVGRRTTGPGDGGKCARTARS